MTKVFTPNKVGFEVLENTGTEIILKRVLKQRPNSNKSRYRDEMALPKLSIHYFEGDDLRQLQEIAIRISSRIVEKRKNDSFSFVKLINSLKKRIVQRID